MKKLKIILQSNYLYFILFIFIAFYCLFFTKIIKYESNYNTQNHFTGVIEAFKIDGNKLSLTLKNKETVVGSFYFKTEEEKKYYENNLSLGKTLEVEYTKNITLGNTIPNTFNYEKYLYNNHIYLSMKIQKITIKDAKINFLFKIKNSFIKRIDNKSPYLNAFILGDKTNINDEEKNIIKENGVSHLFALSGMHLSLVYMFLKKILKKVKIKNIIIYTILFLYLAITGFSISFLRAIIFTLLLDLNKYFKLNISKFKILFLTAFLILLLDPFDLYNVGFLYTFIITFSVFLISNKKYKNKLGEIFFVSLTTFLFSLPITIYLNYEINILSILANVVLVPFVSTVVFPVALISFFITPLIPLFNILINILDKLNVILYSSKIMLIFGSINILEIIIYYLFLILLYLSKRKIFGILIFFLLIFIYNKNIFDNNYYVYILDVGQGSSNLLVSPKKREAIMIDTGGLVKFKTKDWQEKKVSDDYVIKNVVQFLKSIRVRKINHLIFTHGDADHVSYSTYLFKHFKVKSCLLNDGEKNALEKDIEENCHINNYNSKYFNYKFIKTKIYDNENDNSIVTFFDIYNHKFLFMGDASIKVEEEIMKKENLKTDYLILGHHGSKTSSSLEFLKFLKLKYGLISSGRNNLYHHPSREVIEILEKLKIKHLNTQDVGTIEIKINKTSCNIKGILA